MRVSAALLGQQLESIFHAWGMLPEHIGATVDVLVAADLRGIDSHGVGILPLYDEFRRTGKLTLVPDVRVVREFGATALIDGGGGLGHFPSMKAMRLAIEKCATFGLGAVGVRNSNHFGAAGVYALLAAERQLIGLVTSAVWRPAVVPTFGAAPMFGTNPIAFAAPATTHPSFCLDMATSTVALGKIRLAAQRQKPIRPGWATDDHGQPLTDASAALKHRYLTPLGGIPEMCSHKGYGLAAMVEILSTFLPGAFFATTRSKRHPDAERYNVGHFFLAIDPRAFREPGAFEEDLDDMIDALHCMPRADAAQPVLVPGEPELRAVEERSRLGIPIPEDLAQTVKKIAEACGAPYVLDGGAPADAP